MLGDELVDARRELGAAHHRHDDVGHQQVDRAGGALEQRDGGVAVGGDDHVVARTSQDLGDQRPHVGLVVDDEHGRACRSVGEVEHLVRARALLDRRGERDGERGAAAALAVDLDGAAGGAHDVVRGRQAEPGPEARGLVVKKGSKIRAHVGRSMPTPVSVTESTNAHARCRIGAGGDGDLAARRASRRARCTTRFSTACSMRLGSATIVAGLAREVELERDRRTEHLVEAAPARRGARSCTSNGSGSSR